jgi:hypothetical protein
LQRPFPSSRSLPRSRTRKAHIGRVNGHVMDAALTSRTRRTRSRGYGSWRMPSARQAYCLLMRPPLGSLAASPPS